MLRVEEAFASPKKQNGTKENKKQNKSLLQKSPKKVGLRDPFQGWCERTCLHGGSMTLLLDAEEQRCLLPETKDLIHQPNMGYGRAFYRLWNFCPQKSQIIKQRLLESCQKVSPNIQRALGPRKTRKWRKRPGVAEPGKWSCLVVNFKFISPNWHTYLCSLKIVLS